MKTTLFTLLAVEFAVAVVITGSGCLFSHAEANAWRIWHQNPTVENRALYDAERAVNRRYQIGIALVLFATMAVPTTLIVKSQVKDKSTRQP